MENEAQGIEALIGKQQLTEAEHALLLQHQERKDELLYQTALAQWGSKRGFHGINRMVEEATVDILVRRFAEKRADRIAKTMDGNIRAAQAKQRKSPRDRRATVSAAIRTHIIELAEQGMWASHVKLELDAKYPNLMPSYSTVQRLVREVRPHAKH
jgi:hypothetical protein